MVTRRLPNIAPKVSYHIWNHLYIIIVVSSNCNSWIHAQLSISDNWTLDHTFDNADYLGVIECIEKYGNCRKLCDEIPECDGFTYRPAYQQCALIRNITTNQPLIYKLNVLAYKKTIH